jgi:hypothetical protein
VAYPRPVIYRKFIRENNRRGLTTVNKNWGSGGEEKREPVGFLLPAGEGIHEF